MIRTLQIFLGVLMLYFLFLALLAAFWVVPLLISRPAVPAVQPGTKASEISELVWLTPAGLRFARVTDYDSTKGGVVTRTWVGSRDLNTTMQVNGQPYVQDRKGELQAATVDPRLKLLQVELLPGKFDLVLWIMIVAIIVYILFILYLSWQLFRFASLAGKQEFFNLDNRKRLRLFGGFLLVISLVSFLLARCDIFLMEWLTGTTGFIRQQSAPGFQFPEMLIAGMLMFIIAEAFAKGQRLQTEQDLTI